jgi:hypothetical protein
VEQPLESLGIVREIWRHGRKMNERYIDTFMAQYSGRFYSFSGLTVEIANMFGG